MCQERSDLCKEYEEREAGGNELERSEGSFSPASPPAGEGSAVLKSEPGSEELPGVGPPMVPTFIPVGDEPSESQAVSENADGQFPSNSEIEESAEGSADDPPDDPLTDPLEEAGELDPNDLLAWEDDPPPTAANLARVGEARCRSRPSRRRRRRPLKNYFCSTPGCAAVCRRGISARW